MAAWTIVLAVALAIVFLGGGPMMMNWGWGFGPWGWFGGLIGLLFMVAFWGLVIWGIVAFVRWAARQGAPASGGPRETPLDILKARYARGDITKAEFEEKKRDLV